MSSIAYLVPEFPRLSEPFVAREVALVSRRMPVQVISLGRPGDADAAMLAQLEREGVKVEYLLRHFPLRLLRLAAGSAVHRPAQSVRMVRESLAFPRIQSSSAFLRALKAMACAHLVRSRRIAHLHGHWTLPTDVAWICSRATGVSFSFSAHAHDIYEDGVVYADADSRFSLGRRIAAAAFVATCTRRGFDHLAREAGPSAQKVNLIYHGVELDGTVREPCVMTGAPRGATQIVSVGRLVEYKGFDRLVSCCSRLRDDGVRFQCQIVGDGSQRDRLAGLIEQASIGANVALAGSKSRLDVIELLKRADIFVFCGRSEIGQYGLPNVLVEAMACGAAVVATWMPEVDELIEHGDNGLVAREDEELYSALRHLVASPELRAQLARRGRDTIEKRFDADAHVERLVHLLEQACPQEGGP
jgi:glycosyltransferase involved in cell wall biosynthesis